MKNEKINHLISEALEEFKIPNSEWKKIFQYVERGSDFKKVGAACQRNLEKMKCRYLILKALGMDRAAYDFKEGANMRWSLEDELDKLPLPEVPQQYQDKTTSVDNYDKQTEEFRKRSMAGPLKELAQMGIQFVQLYPNGRSSRKRDVEIANEVMNGKIPTWSPASTGLEWRNGRRWDVNQSIIMLNGHTKDGYKWFKYTDHTDEGGGSYGYDIGGPNDGWVGGSEVSVAWCRKWIKDNIIKDDVKESMNKEISFNQLKKLVKESFEINEAAEKFYIVAERDNPQLGTYLSDVYIGKKRINKNSLSCSFNYYGSSKTLKFTLGVSRDNYAKHSCISGDNSIYGSMSYFGFDTAEDAKNYIESKWSSHYNFNKCMKKLNADELTESFVNEAQSPIERLGWAIINEINEDNFIHEMRFKDTNVEDVDTEKNSATLFWMTQEGFDGYDFNQFMKEVRRAALAVSPRAKKYKISEPVTFKVLAVCRDGKWAGYGTRKITVG
jgi:hypothetical protein